ncbi:hypothetical protein QBC35DRAFT_494469 [Podospora australis]|uniref:Dpy-30 domain-containing protein n=1 Tax=Podospora australis TaxID=1536484 RepID=A0AAN6WWW0_9PEZI|nr:hypothetical protein QBC35DRAFT_494469 [Podospora australis]
MSIPPRPEPSEYNPLLDPANHHQHQQIDPGLMKDVSMTDAPAPESLPATTTSSYIPPIHETPVPVPIIPTLNYHTNKSPSPATAATFAPAPRTTTPIPVPQIPDSAQQRTTTANNSRATSVHPADNTMAPALTRSAVSASASAPAPTGQQTTMGTGPQQQQQQQQQQQDGGHNTPASSSFAMPAEAALHGAPVRQYINTKITGVLLEGMKLVAREQPKDPLRVLGEFLLQRSKEIEGSNS